MFCDILEEKLREYKSEDELPNAVIITDVPSEVFIDNEQKKRFSELFTQIEPNAHFDFLRSFRRVRVTFEKPEDATAAKLLTQHLSFNGTIMKTYFAQRLRKRNDDDGLLKLPTIEKQFLISPPASPPVGWEQSNEMAPVVCNFDLMARLAAFSIEDTYEVFSGDEDRPKIIVHPATDSNSELTPSQSTLPKTPRPPILSFDENKFQDE